MEQFKKKGVSYWITPIRAAYFQRENQHVSWYASYLDRKIKEFYDDSHLFKKGGDGTNKPFTIAEIKQFLEWVLTSEGEVWLAQKSPANAVKLSVQNRKRLVAEAEKFILEKAKDRGSLLEYCSTFGIILNNMEKVTLKAAFGEDAGYEKEYIKKIEEMKRQVKSVLTQLVGINQLDDKITVKELLDTL